MNLKTRYLVTAMVSSALTFALTSRVESKKTTVIKAQKQETIKFLQSRIRELETDVSHRQKIIIEHFGDGRVIKRQTKFISSTEKKSSETIPSPSPRWKKKPRPQPKAPKPKDTRQKTIISFTSKDWGRKGSGI